MWDWKLVIEVLETNVVLETFWWAGDWKKVLQGARAVLCLYLPYHCTLCTPLYLLYHMYIDLSYSYTNYYATSPRGVKLHMGKAKTNADDRHNGCRCHRKKGSALTLEGELRQCQLSISPVGLASSPWEGQAGFVSQRTRKQSMRWLLASAVDNWTCLLNFFVQVICWKMNAVSSDTYPDRI
jgi:hypothetical protein